MMGLGRSCAVGPLGAAVLCLSLVLAAGCASPEKPAAAEPVAPPPVVETPEAALLDAEEGLAPRPAPAKPMLRRFTYALRRAVRRPPKIAGRLAVPLRRTWKYIVIHHSGTDEGSEAVFDRYHREQKGWRGIGYDFVIGNGHGSADGLVEVTFRWEQQLVGAHAGDKEYNEHAIGVCLVGDFDTGYPTPKQMEALVGLVNDLQSLCGIPTGKVLMHRQVRPGGTHCPGKNFPWYDFLSMLDH